MIERFQLEVLPEALAELRARLRATRWPAGVGDSGGISLARMRDVTNYWLNEFDWAARAREINAFPHHRAQIGDLSIHFVHVKCGRAHAPTLLLLHGWPGSFIEMLPMVPALAKEFNVVVPSIPGFGLSSVPVLPGVSNERVATLLAELMTALGYERFAVHGGDVGAGIATWLAIRYPSRVVAIHLNYIPGSYDPFVEGEPTPDEAGFLRASAQWGQDHGAYGHVQRTRPLTLGYGLSDSPAALAAWIVEKFDEWQDPSSVLPLDVILTNVSIYWVTNTITSSIRYYLESSRTPLRLERGERIRPPCGVARFPYEAPFPPRSWVERAYDVRRWTEMPRGGHFAALEAPELLAADVAAFVRSVTA